MKPLPLSLSDTVDSGYIFKGTNFIPRDICHGAAVYIKRKKKADTVKTFQCCTTLITDLACPHPSRSLRAVLTPTRSVTPFVSVAWPLLHLVFRHSV